MANCRTNANPDYIYTYSDGSVSWSPDGIGKYWYDSVEEARDDVGNLPVTHTWDTPSDEPA